MYIPTSCFLIITPIRKHTDKLKPSDPEQKMSTSVATAERCVQGSASGQPIRPTVPSCSLHITFGHEPASLFPPWKRNGYVNIEQWQHACIPTIGLREQFAGTSARCRRSDEKQWASEQPEPDATLLTQCMHEELTCYLGIGTDVYTHGFLRSLKTIHQEPHYHYYPR